MSMGTGISRESTISVRTITRDEPMQFEVTVHDAGDEALYRMTMSRADFGRLSGGNARAEDCVRAAFQFLLDREPKEAILRRFDVSVIEQYFPEFRREFSVYLAAALSLHERNQNAHYQSKTGGY